MDFDTPIEKIPRIGSAYQKKLKKLGIENINDLLFHFPYRYEDFSNIIPIKDAVLKQNICIQGEILEIKNIKTWKRKMFLTEAVIQDSSGSIKAIWFNQPYLTDTFKKGDFVCLAGKLTSTKAKTYLSNPSYEKVSQDLTHTGRIVPIYPETRGVSSKWLRFIIKSILFLLKNKIADYIPQEVIKKNHLISFEEAIWQIHFPNSMEMLLKAKQRISFEELFFISLYVQTERKKLLRERAFSIPIKLPILQNFIKSLPFKLTDSQKKSAWQILKDLEKPIPMNRLLEGDVGSGKTIVAAIASLNTAKSGFQVAFMSPTEILAKQHFKTMQNLLKNFDLKICLLTGKEKTMDVNEADIIIGTHALIQDKIKFKKLGLVILDEQHRFGVEQRAKLCKQKIFIPHFLSMSATPIPRTLFLTIYGDLDLSLIDEMPKNRKKVITKFISPLDRNKTYNFVRQEVKKGRQAFIICPRIEPSEISDKTFEKNKTWLETKAAKEEYEKLSKEIFPDLKVGMLHGKMKTKEKEEIMSRFISNKINILVCTSVVEVGVDIPNASIMIIEGADKFGLSQLHQFRGRVGRGEHQSFCFLFSDSITKKTFQRLKAIITCEDGFKLAEKDLEIRGAGDFVGERQWGIPDFAMASLKDIPLVEQTRSAAKEILDKDPFLKNYPLLKKKLTKFRERIHLE